MKGQSAGLPTFRCERGYLARPALGPSPAALRVPDRLQCVPSISGRIEVSLTVRDPAISAAWYSELFDLEVLYDFSGEDGRMRYIAPR